MLLLKLYAAASLCIGVGAFLVSIAWWPRRRDTLAKPGRATVWCRLSQSVAIGAAVGVFWLFVPVALLVIGAAYKWRKSHTHQDTLSVRQERLFTELSDNASWRASR